MLKLPLNDAVEFVNRIILAHNILYIHVNKHALSINGGEVVEELRLASEEVFDFMKLYRFKEILERS
jgi:hypothetical protein